MNKEEMMKNVQMLSFLVYDVALFLDTHPDDIAALNYYDKYRNLCAEAILDYEQQYGPISISNVDIKNKWSWIEKPWPWEMEA